MKKLVITMSIVLISLLGYSQVTNVGEFRVANSTTAFGVNLPVGTKVYNIATGEYWVATAGVASTATLTTGSASFELLNNSGTDDQNAGEVTVSATGNLSSEDVQSALEELQGDIDGISDTDDQTASEVNITDAGDNFTGTTVEAALTEIADAGYITSEVDGSVTNEIQTLDQAQLNGSTLELSLSSDGEATKEIDLSSLQDGTGTDDQTASEVNITDTGDNFTGTTVEAALTEIADAGYITSEVDGSVTNEIQTLDQAQLNGTTLELSLSGDGEATKEIELSGLQDGTGTDDQTASEVNITDTDGDYTSSTVEGALGEIGDDLASNRSDIDQNTSDISDNSTAIAGITSNVSTQLEIGTVNGTSYGITSDGGSDDVILAAATNSSAGVMTATQVTKLEGIESGAQVNLTMITEKFEEDDGTATEHSLAQTAVTAQGCRVSLNGSVLAPANYTFTTSAITIGVPVYQYDQVVITYFY